MYRSLLAFALGLLVVVSARADLASPPAVGKRHLPLQYRIETTTDHPGYDFYTVADGGEVKVPFGPKSPALLYGTAVRRGMFVAVPKGAREKYKSDDDHRLALLVGSIPGQAGSDVFDLREEVSLADKRPGLVYTYTLEKLNAKGRMVLKKSAKAPAVAAPPSAAKDGPRGEAGEPIEPDGAPTAYAPRGGTVVAGLAAALALAFTGLWLARRSRPH